MSTFFMFGRYSQDSASKISSKRTSDAMALINNNGGKFKSGYALLGKYDLCLLVDFPSLEVALKTSVALSKLLGISFSTSPAVPIEDFDKLVV
jgi:uncharacterized protein with GYD domain